MNIALDEDDIALINALQIAPRIPWAEAAPILGATPNTLTRRWQRLRDEGLAWVAAHPSAVNPDFSTAIVEVDCQPGAQTRAIDQLKRDPRVVSIEQASRGRDLMLTVMTRSLDELSSYVLDELVNSPDVRNQRCRLMTHFHHGAGDWRLDALNKTQVAALERFGVHTHPLTVRLPAQGSWPLIEALMEDGRATAAELARRTGRNPATVRRQLTNLMASGVLRFRCEVAQKLTSRPIMCHWFGRVPASEYDRTVAAIKTLPELRMLLTTTGDANLMFSASVRSQADLLRIERVISEMLPSLSITESVINLRTAKRMGWIIGPDDRSTGEVVVPDAIKPR
ncbi:Lrp/AsnC family transcriptional regulator [Rhodococcus erythropolis]|uniref:Lrp/AsnC family transcriptional regulator n=1 Tax=Rhodococcus erythropolis TaxID=1833 RepID=UPI0002FB89CF|nr:Lrp/AsnC family transcriptional regulator [Rhodococcus erythropolis]EQM31825.1 hypothetical protein N601_20240 [Rhodococcus erythropolis DN1]